MSIVTSLIAPVSNLLDKFIEDKDAKNQLLHEVETMAEKHGQQIALAQIEVNKQEAKGNWFQASWRPACAWVCVAGFGVNFLVSPLAAPLGIDIPQADTTTMLPVLLGMLGLAGTRTAERFKGVGK